jgi:hypothetical protein
MIFTSSIKVLISVVFDLSAAVVLSYTIKIIVKRPSMKTKDDIITDISFNERISTTD